MNFSLPFRHLNEETNNRTDIPPHVIETIGSALKPTSHSLNLYYDFLSYDASTLTWDAKHRQNKVQQNLDQPCISGKDARYIESHSKSNKISHIDMHIYWIGGRDNTRFKIESSINGGTVNRGFAVTYSSAHSRKALNVLLDIRLGFQSSVIIIGGRCLLNELRAKK
jgi:hypothetical protein